MKYLAIKIYDFSRLPTENNFCLFYTYMKVNKINIFESGYYCLLLPFFVLQYTKRSVIEWEN